MIDYITIPLTHAIPHSPDHERDVLSSFLHVPSTFDDFPHVTEDHFHLPDTKIIFKFAAEMRAVKNFDVTDIASLVEAINSRGLMDRIGGATGLRNILQQGHYPSFLQSHIETLNHYLARRLAIAAGLGMVRSGFEDADLADVLQSASGPVTAIHDAASASRPPRDTRAIAQEFLAAFEKRMRGEDDASGTPTGISEFDALLGGFKPQQMGIISARAGGGKSTMGTQICADMASPSYPILYLILERTEESAFRRAVIQRAKVNPNMVANPKLVQATKHDLQKMQRVVGSLIESFYIRKPDSRNLNSILAEIRRYVRKNGVKAVFVDQIGLVKGEKTTGDNREAELRGISNSLQEIAHELNITVVVMSQVNNEGETKGARAIEEDADWHLSVVQEMDRTKDNFRQHLHVLLAKDSHNGHGGTKLPLILNHDSLRFEYGLPALPEKKSQNSRANF